jgi:tetratricopeptide (TPR) repeat protein
LSTLSADRSSTISENRGVDPRRLGQVIRGELDWIAMKALEKDPSRRYESASAFAADMQRYLNDEPVQACPPSALYKVKKFALRNKTLVGATIAVTLALIIGATVSLWQAHEAMKAHRTAEHQTELTLRVAMSMFQDIDWLVNEPELQEVRRSYIERAETLFEEMGGEHANNEISFYLGQISDSLSHLYQDWEQNDRAIQYARRSVSLLERYTKTRPFEAKTYGPLANSWFRLAKSQFAQRDFNEAEQSIGQAIEIAERLVVVEPEHVASHEILSSALGLLADLLNDVKSQRAEAITIRQRVVDVDKKTTELTPGKGWYWSNLGASHHNLALLYQEDCRAREAAELFHEAIECQKKALELDPNLKYAREYLANHYAQLGKLTSDQLTGAADAVPWFQKAIETRTHLVQDFPRETRHYSGLADSYRSLGHSFRAQNETSRATDAFEQSLDLLSKVRTLLPDDPDTLRSLANAYLSRGSVYYGLGDLGPAIDDFEHAEILGRMLSESNLPGELRLYSSILQYLAYTQQDLGELEKALETQERAIQIRRRLLEVKPRDPTAISDLGGALHNVATICVHLEQDNRAIDCLEQAITYQRRALELGPSKHVFREFLRNHYNNLSYFLSRHRDPRRRDPARAIEAAQKALELDDKYVLARFNLGVARYRSGELQAAVNILTDADLLDVDRGGNHLFVIAMAYWGLDEKELALEWYKRALAWMDGKPWKGDGYSALEDGGLVRDLMEYVKDSLSAPRPVHNNLTIRMQKEAEELLGFIE